MTDSTWKCEKCKRRLASQGEPTICPACSSISFERVPYVPRKQSYDPKDDHFYYARENDVLYKRNRRHMEEQG